MGIYPLAIKDSNEKSVNYRGVNEVLHGKIIYKWGFTMI